AGEGERHTSEPFLFVEVYRGITLLQYASGLAPFDFQPETEIYFDDGRLSTSPDTQFNKAYIIDFSRSGCIETVIDDGRPAFQRLRGLGVLFDSKQDAQRWLDNHIEGEKWLIQQKRKSCTSGLWSGFQGADASPGMKDHATQYVASALRKRSLGLGAKIMGSRLLLTRYHLDII